MRWRIFSANVDIFCDVDLCHAENGELKVLCSINWEDFVAMVLWLKDGVVGVWQKASVRM